MLLKVIHQKFIKLRAIITHNIYNSITIMPPIKDTLRVGFFLLFEGCPLVDSQAI